MLVKLPIRATQEFGAKGDRPINSATCCARRKRGSTMLLATGLPDMHRLDFDCRPMDGWRARVDVAANTSDRDFYGQRFGYGYGRENPVQRFLGHVFGD